MKKYNQETRSFEEYNIESGEGYIKFPDGTMICYGEISLACSVAKVWGSIFISQETAANKKFAKSFISTPSIQLNNSGGGNAASVIRSSSDKNGILDITISRGTSMVETVFKFSYQAIGRWK